MPGSDFDGDGRDDILWRNFQTGYVSNWLGTSSGGFFVNDALAMDGPFTGVAAAIGDFNGDGLADTLWRSGTSIGTNATFEGGAFYFQWGGGFVADVSADWHIVGAGDFNGDGLDDILWRNDDGRVSNWLSQGDGYHFKVNDANAMTSALAGSTIMGIGDFDGDGKDDLVVRSGTTYQLLLGTDSGAFAPRGGSFADIPSAWQIIGVGDFDEDGNDDLLWRHTNGTISNWLYAGGTGSQTFTVNDANALTQVSTDWVVLGVGDYDGDGRDDILWRNFNIGAVSNWLATENGGWQPNDANAWAWVPSAWSIEPNPAGYGAWDY